MWSAWAIRNIGHNPVGRQRVVHAVTREEPIGRYFAYRNAQSVASGDKAASQRDRNDPSHLEPLQFFANEFLNLAL